VHREHPFEGVHRPRQRRVSGERGSLYSMHQLIADYATLTSDSYERAAVQRRITKHYVSVLKDIADRDHDLSQVALNNFLAAAQLAQQCGHAAEAVELALGLYPHLESLGMWDTSVGLLRPILTHQHVRSSPTLHADILLKLAHSHRLLRNLAQAEALAQSAEMLASQFDASNLLHHTEIVSRVCELQANILMDKGEHHAAIQRSTRALEAALESRSPALAEQARHTLALAFSLSGNYDRMDETLDSAPSPTLPHSPASPLIRVSSALGHQLHLYHCQARTLKAVSLFLQAKLPEADNEAAAALDIARKSHNRRWIILLLEWLGWIRVTLGQYDSVLNLMSEVFSLARTGDFKEDLIFLYVDLGLVAKARGAFDEAEQHLLNALTLANQVAPDHMNGRATMHCTLARIQLAKDQLDQAEVQVRLSFSSADNPIETIPPLSILGYVKARQGNPHESDDCFAQALAQGKRFGPINFATHYRAESALHLGRHAPGPCRLHGCPRPGRARPIPRSPRHHRLRPGSCLCGQRPIHRRPAPHPSRPWPSTLHRPHLRPGRHRLRPPHRARLTADRCPSLHHGLWFLNVIHSHEASRSRRAI